MKNRLFLATLLTGTTLAFAPTMSSSEVGDMHIDLYGMGHISTDAVYNGYDTDIVAASNASRLGIKGGMNLGSELNAVIQYETGVDLTGRGKNDGNGNSDSSGQLLTTSRDSFTGLQHTRFGELVAGRVGGLNQWLYDYNLFADQVGDLGNIWGGHGLFDRVRGSLQYTSPEIAGMKLRGLVASKEGLGDNDDVWLAKADYGKNSLRVGLAYMNQGSTTSNDHQAFACTASYMFGYYSLGGGYQREINANGINGNDFNSVTLGGTAQLELGVFKAQVAWIGDGVENNTGAIQWAVGYDYNLIDDNLTIYIAYAGVSNDDNASFSVNNYGHGQNMGVDKQGDDPSAVSLGFIYRFQLGI